MDIDMIKNLYLNELLSAQEVANRLNMTVWQVIRILKKHNIPRRKSSQTTRINFLRSPLSYSFKSKLSRLENELWIAGLMLYWAEGYKAGTNVVDFANSDEDMLLTFLKMLRSIYRVRGDRLRVYLYCYSNQNTSQLITFWSELLSIPAKQFSKPYVRSDFNPEKIGKMKNGLIHIRYADTRLLEQIKLDIGKIRDKLSRNTQAVNEVTL